MEKRVVVIEYEHPISEAFPIPSECADLWIAICPGSGGSGV